jgi:thiamine-phosphate pyrophosphorylase
MILVISSPSPQEHEGRTLSHLMECGVERIHIRKPGAATDVVAQLLREVPDCFHARLVVHGHPQLVDSFKLAGVHGRDIPGAVSCSIHELGELAMGDRYNYLLFGPIFPSISKPGYRPRIPFEECSAAVKAATGCVVAIGGITAQTAPQARRAGFSGVAVLGAVWNSPDPRSAYREIRRSWEEL